MSIESRVSDTIAGWCGQAPAVFSITIEDLWTLTQSEPFDPDGIELLIQAIEKEFQATLSPQDFRPGGKVSTVHDLIREAAAFPEMESDVRPAKKAPARKKAKKSAVKKKAPRRRRS